MIYDAAMIPTIMLILLGLIACFLVPVQISAHDLKNVCFSVRSRSPPQLKRGRLIGYDIRAEPAVVKSFVTNIVLNACAIVLTQFT